MLVFVLGSSHLSRLFSRRWAADVNSTLQTLAESTCVCVMWALSASHSSLPPTLIHTAPIWMQLVDSNMTVLLSHAHRLTPKQQTEEAPVLMSWYVSALSAVCVCFKPLFLFQSQNWSQRKQIKNLSPLPSTLLHRVQHLRTPCCETFLTQWGPLQLQAHWRWTEQVHKDGSFYFDVIWPILQCFA